MYGYTNELFYLCKYNFIRKNKLISFKYRFLGVNYDNLRGFS